MPDYLYCDDPDCDDEFDGLTFDEARAIVINTMNQHETSAIDRLAWQLQ